MLLPAPKDERRCGAPGDSVRQRLGIPDWRAITRVREQAAMHTLRTLAIAILLAFALVDHAAAAVGMGGLYQCRNPWPGWMQCGTLSSPPTPSTCGDWVKWDNDYGYCDSIEPGLNNAPSATPPAGQVLPGADPVDLTTGIFMLTKVDAAFPG